MGKSENNKIIVFANQKGGVGKTTLCTMFANYLVGLQKRVLVIDCDLQQTIYDKRKKDLQRGLPENYAVQAMPISEADKVQRMMEMAEELDGFVLIDAPGNLTQQGLIPILTGCDVIVCPYQYEMTSINSTVTFIKVVNALRSKVEQMTAQLFLVPNRVDKRYGTAEELELWKKTDETFNTVGKVTPRIDSRADIQRYNSVELSAEQEKTVSPCFDFIFREMFNS